MSAAPWSTLQGSERGSQHDRSGRPNQDAVHVATFGVDVGAVTVAAVADGHGGDRYVRSDVGSRLAVEVACAEAGRLVARGATAVHAAGTALPHAIVAAWRVAVHAHLAEHPLDVRDARTSGVVDGGDPVIAYGTTLLVALASATDLVLLQLGDGDITVVTAAGDVLHPVPGDARLTGGQTTSLCLPGADGDVRSAVLTSEYEAVLVLLSSDGYGNSFADPEWPVGVTRDLVAALDRDGVERVGTLLPVWLRDSAQAGGDDVTAAVLFRPAAAARQSSSAAGAAAPAASASVTPSGNRTRRAQWATTAAVAVVVSSAAFGTGWLLRGRNRSTTAVAVGTSVPASTEVSGGPVNVAGPTGGVVSFNPDPADPRPRLLASSDAPVRITRLERGGDVWEIQARLLTVRSRTGTATVPLAGVEPASLVLSGAVVWVVDAGADTLLAIDPGTRAIVGIPARIEHGAVGGGSVPDWSAPVPTPSGPGAPG